MSLAEDLKKKTVPQLRSYAKKNNIDLFGANTKSEILEVVLCFVPKEGANVEKKKSLEKIALFSQRNLHWNPVGSLDAGYNIVTKEDSVKWLRHKAVRIATPEEVAAHYGKI